MSGNIVADTRAEAPDSTAERVALWRSPGVANW
jgi:hypothetical protein